MSVVILGGGISGLLAAWALRDRQPVVIEAGNALGGTYTQGGLKYVRQTPAFEALLTTLKIPFSLYQPRGAMLTAPVSQKPTPVAHPEWMCSQPSDVKHFWQAIHWVKTRGSMAGFKDTCMNDPSGEGGSPALAFDHHLMLHRLEGQLRVSGTKFVFNTKVVGVERDHLRVQKRAEQVTIVDGYSTLLTTLALPLMSKLAPWAGLPTGALTKWLTVAFFKALPNWFIDAGCSQFDYVYTPLMGSIHRMSKYTDKVGRSGWQAEASGKVEPSTIVTDLGFPGYEDAFISHIVTMPGHLIPLEETPVWPKGMHPIGRFAEWNSRATAETVLDLALELRDAEG